MLLIKFQKIDKEKSDITIMSSFTFGLMIILSENETAITGTKYTRNKET